MPRFEKSEVEGAHDRYLDVRSRVLRGELSWPSLAECFTEDATFIDPAWGRIVGRKAIADFFVTSMAGLEDWAFPHEWRLIDDSRLVASWMLRLPGQRSDGTYFEARGLSILTYAGSGLFSFEEDLLNMVHVTQLIQESGWEPSASFNMPPPNPPR